MGNIVGGGIGPACGRLESIFHAGHIARGHLRPFDHGHHAAKRRSGRLGGCVRRRGQPDSVWPARCRNLSFQGDNLVRHHVHADFHGADHASELDRGVNRQLRVATVLEDAQTAGACGSCFKSTRVSTGVKSGPGRSSAGSTCAAEISWTVNYPAADSLPRITKFFHLTSSGSEGTCRHPILRTRQKVWQFESSPGLPASYF
jgi:hypothetical protein